MNYLLMDIGSTFVKYAVYDAVAKQCGDIKKVPFPSTVIADGTVEVSKDEIDSLILSVAKEACGAGCTKAFISVQMHGYLLKQNGAFSNYVSWQDQSGDVEKILPLEIDFVARGTRAKKNLPIVKLYPKREELAGAELFTLGSYVSYILTGNNCTHKTDACACGFFTVDCIPDTDTVKGLTLPKVTDGVALCGNFCGMAVYTPLGDHAVSYLGSGADGDAYLLNIGTASQIAFLADGAGTSKIWEYRPYFDGHTRLVTLSGVLCGGGALDSEDAQEKMCADIVRELDALPKRERLLLGGGGALRIYEKLSAVMSERGVKCVLSDGEVGMAGLCAIADAQKADLGMMLSEIPFANMILLLKNNNFDFMIIDNEHGSFDYSDMTKMFAVARLAPLRTIVRLPDNNRAWITKCVDAGADGFLLPMTNSASDIAKVVEYAKYTPIGKRGISTMRAHTLYAPPSLDKYMSAANEHVKVYAQIETRAGVENVDEILAERGVDGVFVGPNDLSCDLGCIGDTKPILECIEKVAAAAAKCGKKWGIITTSKALLDKALELSVDMISYGSELHMLDAECKKIRGMF
ncbi:MAG: hypothetical protein IJ002_07450 [Clostridia bacterium]|nr:hypothetical protein [Clostridia bacterium]